MFKIVRRQSGFTLIEMIVVFAVISILSTVAIAAFVNYNKSQVLQIAASNISATLGLAKSRALSQSKPAQCVSPSQILNGYEVDLTFSDNSYTLYAVCGGNHYSIQKNYLPQNVAFGASSQQTIFFPVIVSGVVGSGTIYLTGYGSTKTVVVDAIGGIK